MFDADLKTTFVNQCLCEMLGYNAQEILGCSPFTFMDTTEVEKAKRFFEPKTCVTGKDYLRFRQRNGNDLWTAVSITPIPVESSQRPGLLAMVADISKLKEAEESLRELNAELESKVAERTSQLHQLLGQIISIQEDERRKISQGFHDEVGQLMTRLILNLTSARNSISFKHIATREMIEDSVQIAIETMDQLRQIAHLLRPPALDTMSFPKVVEGLCNSYARETQLNISFNCQTDLPDLPEMYSISLYRLAQESLTNIVKHSDAESVWVSIDCEDEVIRLSIEDDGKGFTPEADSTGIGLQGLQERFHLLEGGLEIESSPNRGTCLAGYLPIESVLETQK